MNEVYVIVTEVNGYKNIYGHVFYQHDKDAVEALKKAKQSGKYDDAWITIWEVV